MTFRKVIKEDFKNADRIYPIQQHKVYEFIQMVKNNPNVIRLTVFGSSVTDRCHTGSDVDFYADLKKDDRIETQYMPFLYDIWTNFTVSDNMKREIDRKGVVVYEKDR